MSEQLSLLLREQLQILQLYVQALDSGDLTILAAILQKAEHDPPLERLLLHMNEVYLAEAHIRIASQDLAPVHRLLAAYRPAEVLPTEPPAHLEPPLSLFSQQRAVLASGKSQPFSPDNERKGTKFSFEATEDRMQANKEQKPTLPMPTTPASPPQKKRHPARRRMISAFTALAALALITVIAAGLLASHTDKSSQTGHPGNGTAPAAVSQTATSAFGNQSWVSVPGLTGIQAHGLSIAPSNPQILYEVTSNPLTLQRTDDGGATWNTLPLPLAASQLQDAGITVNARNAQQVFLAVVETPTAACPSAEASLGQVGGYSSTQGCLVNYYSTDGGEHWVAMQWNAQSGRTGNVIVDGTGAFDLQGNRLYGWVSERGTTRIILSADGGATWQFADEALTAQGQAVCSFAAAPTGSTIFAETQAGHCTIPASVQWHDAIWRSDDAGVHWEQVEVLPSPDPDSISGLLLAHNQFALLSETGTADGGNHAWMLSTDGAKTWQTVPTRGLPANGDTSGIPGTVLSDGSVLGMVGSGPAAHATCYAWKPGTSIWKQVSPLIDGDWDGVIGVSSSGGHDTLWVVASQGGQAQRTFTVESFTIK